MIENSIKILSNLPGCVYWKDKNSVYLGCNIALAQLAKLDDPNQLIGKTDFDFINRETALKLIEHDKRVMASGKMEILQERVTIEGNTRIFISHKSPLKDSDTGEIIGVIGVSIEITRTKETEKT